MTGYYVERLSGHRLRECYEIAPPRIRQYLEAEMSHVAARIHPSDRVLELGCGYGRALQELIGKAGMLVGIDTSSPSLQLAEELMRGWSRAWFLAMDAAALGFGDHTFDIVLCIQNGLSAFKVDSLVRTQNRVEKRPWRYRQRGRIRRKRGFYERIKVDQRALIGECIRVARPGGRILFSTYAKNFWEDRLAWFQLQSDHGLLGEIDHHATGDGVIVCKDGFRATTISPDDFVALMAGFNVHSEIEEVDGSSLFCEIIV